MTRLILLETSTALCSVALCEDDRVVGYIEDSTRSHASLTAPFVEKLLDDRGLGVKDCDAVCVGMGPGSYTGLRVGVSTAKGLCMGAGIPLIAVGSMEALACQAVNEGLLPEGCRAIVPMIDARRMEVYSAVFSPSMEMLSPTEATIVEADSFSEYLSQGNVLFIGDGALKCRSVIQSGNAFFQEACPKASSMLGPALARYNEKKFEDVAYFEPFYLKEFIATVSRKRLV